jgi:hypothetical protein
MYSYPLPNPPIISPEGQASRHPNVTVHRGRVSVLAAAFHRLERLIEDPAVGAVGDPSVAFHDQRGAIQLRADSLARWFGEQTDDAGRRRARLERFAPPRVLGRSGWCEPIRSSARAPPEPDRD